MAKRNLLKVPQHILDCISAYDQDDVVVACVKFLRPEDITHYSHLGMAIENSRLVLPDRSVPKPNAGRYSRANIEGYEKVRRDLPKVSKEFENEVPDWGNWSSGSHTVSWTREVYQRDFYPPKEVEMSVELLEEIDNGYSIKFAIEQVINRRTQEFEKELLYNLNILQENIGAVNVFKSVSSLAEYTATIHVDWQIFPPGTIDEVVQKIVSGKKGITTEQEKTITERVSSMSRLNPVAYVAGTDNFLRYFGAQFGDDLVCFENVRYGNALYVMHESWKELSKRSRIDLLRGDREQFTRIEHRDGWEVRIKKIVDEYRTVMKNRAK